jgi:hypothetical protein
MFIQKPKKEYIDEAGVKVQKWLTTHNLPHWSPLVVWFIITLPSIATAYFKLPLAIVLLLSGGGFAGLLWLLFYRNNSQEDSAANGVEIPSDSAVELHNQEELQVRSHNSQNLPQPEFVSEQEIKASDHRSTVAEAQVELGYRDLSILTSSDEGSGLCEPSEVELNDEFSGVEGLGDSDDPLEEQSTDADRYLEDLVSEQDSESLTEVSDRTED